jgi:hypothetical protein
MKNTSDPLAFFMDMMTAEAVFDTGLPVEVWRDRGGGAGFRQYTDFHKYSAPQPFSDKVTAPQ